MSALINPFERNREGDRSEKSALIKFWTRDSLPLSDESIVTVSEFACNKPSCPDRQTIILLMSELGPTQKISIHKAMADVCEADVFEGCLQLLRNWPE